MVDVQNIREHQEVVGSDGEHIGTVDHLDGNTIKLTKNDKAAFGQHHWVPLELVDSIDGEKVRLNVPTGEAQQQLLSTGPTHEVCARLEHLELPFLDAEVRPYFRDVLDHVRRVEVEVDGLREVLSSVFEASHVLEQQRQGEITRRLAAWAAILAVPTAVAGIYGMNFEVMPELKWKYGYYLILAVIAVICAILYTQFKRAKWL